MCEINSGVRVTGHINSDSFLENIHTYQPLASSYSNDHQLSTGVFFQVQFGCPLCLESFLFDYEANELDAEYEIWLYEPNVEVITHILQNLESSSFEIDQWEATITFSNIKTSQIFIVLYNDIIDGLEIENGTKED